MMWLSRQLRCCGDWLFPSSRRLLLTSLRPFSQSAGSRDAPPPPAEPASHFMVDYLVSSCGLSGAEALRASKPLAHLKSPERPDAVLGLLRQEGLGDAHIRHAVLRFPRVLLADADKTLEPRIRALQGAGFSGPEIAEVISTGPKVVLARDVAHRVEFWRKLIGSNQSILKTIKRNPNILCYRLENVVIPRLSLWCSLGVPDSRMGMLARTRPRLVCSVPYRIKALVERARSLGFSPGSKMFVSALAFLSNLSRSTLDAKTKLLRSFGWAEAELASAIRTFPCILVYSEKRIRAVMDFLLNEAGCEPSYIAARPVLVGYSMEKRLMPRCYVLQSLKMKGLPSRGMDLWKAMQMTEYNFAQKFIIPYNDQLPELLESYNAQSGKTAKSNIGSL